METINISIPADWLPEQPPDSAELREALRIGLRLLRRRHRDRVRQALVQAGLAQARVKPASNPPLTPEQRRELARRVVAAGPLSDIIIADRADRV